nr:RING-H2 finger protein ATL32-like [Lolium perenne]
MSTSGHSSGDSTQIALAVAAPVVLALIVVLFWTHRRAARARRRELAERRRRASASASLQAALAVLRMQAPPPPMRTRYRDGTSSGSSVPRGGTREPAVATEELLVCTYLRGRRVAEATCPVCLSEMEDGETVRVLPVCMHYFHDACVGEWLRENDTCPLCRGPPSAGTDPAAAV